jgi:hypothetical protein
MAYVLDAVIHVVLAEENNNRVRRYNTILKVHLIFRSLISAFFLDIGFELIKEIYVIVVTLSNYQTVYF